MPFLLRDGSALTRIQTIAEVSDTSPIFTPVAWRVTCVKPGPERNSTGVSNRPCFHIDGSPVRTWAETASYPMEAGKALKPTHCGGWERRPTHRSGWAFATL